MRPVINERLVPKEEVSHLFGNVEQLLPINEELLKGLKSAPIDELRVGQVFIERASGDSRGSSDDIRVLC